MFGIESTSQNLRYLHNKSHSLLFWRGGMPAEAQAQAGGEVSY